MSRPQLPYFPKITGYTMPIVIDALDVLGPPNEIAKIAKNQQGPMLVTLAGELATIVGDLIIANLVRGRFGSQFADLRAIHGGKKYQDLLLELKEVEGKKYELYDDLFKLERSLLTANLATTTHGFFRNCKKTKSALAGSLFWNPAEDTSILKVATNSYGKLSRQYQRTAKSAGLLAKREKASRMKIDELPAFQKAKVDLTKKLEARLFDENKGSLAEQAIRVSFANTPALGDDGAAHYLRNTDATWWRAFTDFIERKVEHDAFVSPARIIMRDGILVGAIDAVAASGKITIDAASQQVLTEPSSYNSALPWPKHSIGKEGVRQLRKVLRDEDSTAQEWIQKRAGKNHPSDKYRSWLCKRQGTTKALRADYLIKKCYGQERAVNELYWCLSRRNSKGFPFKGFFSSVYPSDFWEKQTQQWSGKAPDYFAY